MSSASTPAVPSQSSDPEAEARRRQLETVCNHTSLAIFVLDECRRCRYMNPAAERLSGFTFAECHGRTLHEILHHTRPDGTPYPLCESPFNTAFPPDHPNEGEEIFLHKDGHFYPVRYLASPIAEEGRQAGTILEVRDISREREAEQALRRSEERYKRASETGRVGIWEFNIATYDFFMAPELKAMLGYRDEEIANRLEAWCPHVHPDDLEPMERAVEEHLAGKTAQFEIEVRRRHKNGGYLWFLSRGTAWRHENGAPYLMIGSDTDITERKKVQEALSESEARLRALFEATPECVKVVEAGGTLLSMNRAGLDSIEAETEASVRGRCVFELISPDCQEQWRRNHRRVCEGESLSWDFQIVGLRGTPRWMETHAVPLPLPDGSMAQLAVTRDISERKRIEEEREHLLAAERAARTDAERNSRLKDDFLATLSHELRTPLTAILGWSTLLRAEPVDPDDLRQGLETIERNARAQTQIIEDLLDMSRIISGKIRLDVQRVDLLSVIEAAMETVRPAAQAKEIRLQPVLDPHTGLVSGDPNRLQQVLWNLLSNAIKFTPRGGRVQILLERVNSHIEIGIVDSGQGIKPEFLPYVFERFRQGDASTTRRHGGLGLGLAIVKNLVEMHGGSISAKSGGEHLGATFTVALPLTIIQNEPETERRHPRSPHRTQPLEAVPELGGIRILVVDDEPDARELVKRLLEDRGGAVRTAASAADALALMKKEKPAVLISDIGMPEEDGYSLIRKIRKLPPEEGRDVPAIALTAFARSEDRMRAILSGFQMHLSKPVESAELIAMVASLAGRLK